MSDVGDNDFGSRLTSRGSSSGMVRSLLASMPFGCTRLAHVSESRAQRFIVFANLLCSLKLCVTDLPAQAAEAAPSGEEVASDLEATTQEGAHDDEWHVVEHPAADLTDDQSR